MGYVHAIAHTVGGFYGLPHGLANAIIMPHVLEYYGSAAEDRLAELADHIGIGAGARTPAEKFKLFIAYIRDRNEKMGIPRNIDKILDGDVPKMTSRALAEANPLYPVPRILFGEDLARLYAKIKGAPAA